MNVLKTISLLTLLALLANCSCSKNSTEPPGGPDTTSHDFSWEMVEFGGVHGSSVLYDVAIINENDIWAVGEIHTAETDTFDSLGNWVNPYNAVHWNGNEWEMKRIQFLYFCDQTGTFPAPAKSVIAFSHDDVFITAGSQVAHWNGEEQDNIECIPVSVNKLWGTDRNNLYAVGALGKIAHYNGSSWQRIESGTDLPIQDIWGAMNPRTGNYEVLAVASLQNIGRGLDLLQISGNSVTKADTTGLHVNQSSVWFIPEKVYYVTGNGVFRKERLRNPPWQLEEGHPPLYKDAIRGLQWNDIFIAGSFGLITHYNGSTWKVYSEEEVPPFFGRYNALDYHSNLCVAVGNIGGERGIILRGRRQE